VALTVVLDACVLYSAPVRDLLLNLAETGLYRPRWTEAIHNEWTRNLRPRRPDLSVERIERTRLEMDKSVLDCLITGYESLIVSLNLSDVDDRHVLAAAIHAHADVIVTSNIGDFPGSSLAGFDIGAWHPDKLVLYLLDLDDGMVCSAIRSLRSSLKKPAFSPEAYLENLAKAGLLLSAARLGPYVSLI
jgi:PIN domain